MATKWSHWRVETLLSLLLRLLNATIINQERYASLYLLISSKANPFLNCVR